VCYKATRPRAPMFRCEWCGIEVYRQLHRDPTKHARRFCSKRCSGALKHAVVMARNESICAERQIQRELKRAATHAMRAQRSCRSCGGSIPHQSEGVYCSEACRTAGTGTNVRETRHKNKNNGVKHLCPNCGQWFPGHERDVFCSAHCHGQMSKRTKHGHRRYPSLDRLPIDERNQLAEFLALIRTVRRHINANPEHHV
jgi:predicted nucleic acid-binding Zn ribbon protein